MSGLRRLPTARATTERFYVGGNFRPSSDVTEGPFPYFHSKTLGKVYLCIVFENHSKKSQLTLSETSYVYILSGQKFVKNAKNGSDWQVFENLKFTAKQCSQTGHF